MLAYTLAFLLGIVIPTTWPFLPPWWLFCVLALIVQALLKRYLLDSRLFGRLVVIGLLGIAWVCYRATNLQLNLPQSYFTQPVVVVGPVVSIPDYQHKQLKFEYSIETVDNKPVKPLRVLLTAYSHQVSALNKIQLGQYCQLVIRLKKPRGFWNTGSFDQQSWLLQKGIVAVGTIVSLSNPISAHPLSNYSFDHPLNTLFYTILELIQYWRLTLKKRIQLSVSRDQHIGLLAALVVGMRQEISPTQWEVMRATGTNHLFSISGLQVGFVTSLVYIIVRFLWSCSSLLCLWMPARQVAYIGGWLGAIGYGAISGFALPVQRVLIMLSIFMIMLLRRRVLPGWQGFCTALIILLLINPFIVLSASFWLSFGAIAIIFYGLGARLAVKEKSTVFQKLWSNWGNTQWTISIGLFPMGIWFFQQVSIVGFVANLVAIPCVGFIVLPLSLLGAVLYPVWPYGMRVLIALSDTVLTNLWHLLSYLAGLSLSHYFLVIPNWWIFLSTSLGTLCLIAPPGFPSAYYLAAVGCLPLLLWRAPVPKPNEFWLTLLDVGQGLSAVVRTHTHTLVYDTGPQFSAHTDAGSMVIIPYLRTLGIRKIDTLVISHGDKDHSGGAESLLKAGGVGLILTSELSRLGVTGACACYKGQHWNWDGVNFSILHPLSTSTLKGNDASCVLKVSNQAHQMLLPGDIHKRGERALLANNVDLTRITALVAPHHGSKTSSSIDFVKRISPKYVLFPVGYRNRFKFPHTSIVARYEKYHSQLYSTDKEGMITLKFKGSLEPIEIESFYQKHRRFWHSVV